MRVQCAQSIATSIHFPWLKYQVSLRRRRLMSSSKLTGVALIEGSNEIQSKDGLGSMASWLMSELLSTSACT